MFVSNVSHPFATPIPLHPLYNFFKVEEEAKSDDCTAAVCWKAKRPNAFQATSNVLRTSIGKVGAAGTPRLEEMESNLPAVPLHGADEPAPSQTHTVA